MKILVTGKDGQLGYDVLKEGDSRGLAMVGIGRNEVDLNDRDQVFNYIVDLKPDAIIHCAAYTAVDKAEDDQSQCWRVNVEATGWIAEASKLCGAKMMYISTDYVFNGEENSPFKEDREADPINFYGLSKYEGEKLVRSFLEEWFILRISWVFGINGSNFVRTMLRLSETRNDISVVNDQYGSPTYTKDVARLIIDMIQTSKYGLYHATNEGYCNWANFAKEIFKYAELKVNVHEISSAAFPTRASRPRNSRLSKSRLVEQGFQPLPAWQDALLRYMHELVNEKKVD